MGMSDVLLKQKSDHVTRFLRRNRVEKRLREAMDRSGVKRKWTGDDHAMSRLAEEIMRLVDKGEL